MVHIEIKLSNSDQGVFYTGETLKGTVDLNLDAEKVVNGFYLKFSGEAKCGFTTGSGKSLEYHDGIQVYMDQKTYLYGSEGAEASKMPAGFHQYNFEIELPVNLPATINMTEGSIRYFVKACLDIPWAFDKEFSVDFIVARRDDYNRSQQHKVPRTYIKEISSCSLCNCSDSPVLAEVTIPYSIFTPGSTIPVTINVNNRSKRNIEQTEVKLKRIVKYHSYKIGKDFYSSKETQETVAKSIGPRINSRNSKSFVVELKLPQNLETSNSLHCRVVQISYSINVKIFRGRVQIPMTISLVPLNFVEVSAPSTSNFTNNTFSRSSKETDV